MVEFISDRQLEFYTEQEELQPFEVIVCASCFDSESCVWGCFVVAFV